MSKLIINIKELFQVRDKGVSFISAKEMDKLPSINNAYLLIENGKISEFGKMSEISDFNNSEIIDAKNKFVFIVKNYPSSDFAADAKFKINLIEDIIASKEMYIGRHYIKKKKIKKKLNFF